MRASKTGSSLFSLDRMVNDNMHSWNHSLSRGDWICVVGVIMMRFLLASLHLDCGGLPAGRIS